MNKKGFFFLIDAVMALTVFASGFFIIFSSYANIPDTSQTHQLAGDLQNLFSTKIGDLNHQHSGYYGALWNNGTLTNEDNTIIQQVGEFYYSGNYDLADAFLEAIIDDVLPESFLAEVYVQGTLMYNRPTNNGISDSRDNARVLVVKKTVVYGVDNTNLWGPYKAEIHVWQG